MVTEMQSEQTPYMIISTYETGSTLSIEPEGYDIPMQKNRALRLHTDALYHGSVEVMYTSRGLTIGCTGYRFSLYDIATGRLILDEMLLKDNNDQP